MRQLFIFLIMVITTNVCGQSLEEVVGVIPTLNPEIPAHFPGDVVEVQGDNSTRSYMSKSFEMNKFISQNLQYPQTALENGIQGVVYLQFIIQVDGKISDIAVIRSVDSQLTEEAIRVVKLMPRWIPAMDNGKPVVSKQSIPIRFKIIDNKKK